MTTVLFACVHNAGRSQMAAAWFNLLSDPTKARAISAGTDPGSLETTEPTKTATASSEGVTTQFVIRASGNPTDVAASARTAVASVDPELPLVGLRPMAEVASAASGQPRFTTLVMSVFAGVAFLLAALGLYGMLAYSVEQRIREIGVRVALGAGRGEVLRLIIGHGMRLTVIGAMVGLPAALAVARLMGGVVPGTTGGDPITYAGAVALLAASAFVASYLPARRATRVDPLEALRSD